ncbi:hypothetical protein [Burkholderia alba]|uniref:hypothetical protein n=1 Tax=Burkholderia alba TaxID=2683677 RepID=UPI002B05D19F|nr:hypothetical protein [Burkholderia alba]
MAVSWRAERMGEAPQLSGFLLIVQSIKNEGATAAGGIPLSRPPAARLFETVREVGRLAGRAAQI